MLVIILWMFCAQKLTSLGKWIWLESKQQHTINAPIKQNNVNKWLLEDENSVYNDVLIVLYRKRVCFISCLCWIGPGPDSNETSFHVAFFFLWVRYFTIGVRYILWCSWFACAYFICKQTERKIIMSKFFLTSCNLSTLSRTLKQLFLL